MDNRRKNYNIITIDFAIIIENIVENAIISNQNTNELFKLFEQIASDNGIKDVNKVIHHMSLHTIAHHINADTAPIFAKLLCTLLVNWLSLNVGEAPTKSKETNDMNIKNVNLLSYTSPISNQEGVNNIVIIIINIGKI